jgi:hypothetical protein
VVTIKSTVTARSPAGSEKDPRHQESDAIRQGRNRYDFEDPGFAEQHHASHGKKYSNG